MAPFITGYGPRSKGRSDALAKILIRDAPSPAQWNLPGLDLVLRSIGLRSLLFLQGGEHALYSLEVRLGVRDAEGSLALAGLENEPTIIAGVSNDTG